MYVRRHLAPALHRVLQQFPVVLITGPRQSGKTTFLKNELGDRAAYVSFDDPLEREFARTDPNGFLARFDARPVVLDEIQYVPGLLPYLKLRVDAERRRYGRWILTGSQQFALMQGVSESLAGRVALLELLPFDLDEADEAAPRDLAEALWTGFYPEPALEPAKRDAWLRSYLATYVERDVRQVLNVKDHFAFEQFLGLVAARHGQIVNMADLGRDAGVSKPTVKSWLGILQASYVIRLVQPWFQNYGKRLAKSPRLYFVDPALPQLLTRQPSAQAALAGALGGALFEGLVAGEAVKAFTSRGLAPDVWMWRAQDGLEVDLLVRTPRGLLPIEVKLTTTPSAKHVEPLTRFCGLAANDACPQGALVCRVEKPTALPHGHTALPWREFPAWLGERLSYSMTPTPAGR